MMFGKLMWMNSSRNKYNIEIMLHILMFQLELPSWSDDQQLFPGHLTERIIFTVESK